MGRGGAGKESSLMKEEDTCFGRKMKPDYEGLRNWGKSIDVGEEEVNDYRF